MGPVILCSFYYAGIPLQLETKIHSFLSCFRALRCYRNKGIDTTSFVALNLKSMITSTMVHLGAGYALYCASTAVGAGANPPEISYIHLKSHGEKDCGYHCHNLDVTYGCS